MIEAIRRSGVALVWLIVVSAIALGAAGLVTATPGSVLPAARPELTGTEDAAITRELDSIEADLGSLAGRVDTLGTQARGALSALVGGQTETAATAIATGNQLVDDIGVRAAIIGAALARVPYVEGLAADLHVSPAVQARYARLRDGLAATEGLDASWARLTSGALVATRLSASLAEHDRLVGLAAERGREARYKDALVLLGRAADQITISRELRTQLANTVDVSVLDEWLGRNESYDKALGGLYTALTKVSGRVTSAVRNAIAAEKEARKRLPPDSRGLILIIAEIGRGGMNGAVIGIEETKATLTDALTPTPSQSPIGGPDATPSGAP
jgi:hypothetical protein